MARVMTNKGGAAKAPAKPKKGAKPTKAPAVAGARAAVNPDETQKMNKSNRKATIQEVCQEVVALEAERNEISAAIAALKQTKIKGALGMKIADFNAALRIYRLDRDDRAEFLDTIQETFEALGVKMGETRDFFAKVVKVDRATVEADTKIVNQTTKEAKTAGREAGRNGAWPSACPDDYPEGSAAALAWEEGRLEGQTENVQKLGKGAGEPAAGTA